MPIIKSDLQRFFFHQKLRWLARRWAPDFRDEEHACPQRIQTIQSERLHRLLTHCFQNVPYYAEIFKRIGLAPEDLDDPNILYNIPILEKQVVRNEFRRLIATNQSSRNRREAATGGSTGVPLRIYADKRVSHALLSNRMLRWWGVDVSDNSGYLYRAIPQGFGKILTSFAIYPTRRAYIHAAEMSTSQMRAFHNRLNAIKARYLVGYVGAVDAFADYLTTAPVGCPSLKAIWTSAAPLPPFKRIAMEDIFGCKVFTQYGSVEIPFLAAECSIQDGLHSFADLRCIEVVDEDGRSLPPGEFGDIVVTDLTNYVFPLVRYRLGDRGRWLGKECPCGVRLPMLDYVKGRVSDKIYLRDGTSIPGEYWTTIFDEWPNAVKAFQVHQQRDFSILVRYTPAGHGTETAIAAVRSTLLEKLKGLAPLSFEIGEIDTNDNGKTRYVLSDVEQHISPADGMD